MLLVLSTMFSVLAIIAIALVAVIAVYMVLGLVLVENLRECDNPHQALQLQTQFLANGMSRTIKVDLEEYGVFGSPQLPAKPSFPSGDKKSVVAARANKQQTTSTVYGVAPQ